MTNESETELSPLAPNVKSIFIEMLVSMKTVNTMFVLDNTPNYACLKSDCKEACLGCDSVVLREKGLYDCYVSDLEEDFLLLPIFVPMQKPIV
ncbi:hypothetical protein G9A89_023753 [Geosiphon pyriformis]|nr:hypothetical protein G9A89_023753 [Geosiphon pyriformis]